MWLCILSFYIHESASIIRVRFWLSEVTVSVSILSQATSRDHLIVHVKAIVELYCDASDTEIAS